MAKSKPTPAAAPATTPAEYTVVARRYRPQQFAELIGQEHVAKALVNALETGRVAHAYLFTGARGVGKTSAARILAKALNCEKGPTSTPCDKCTSCLAIANGDVGDVIADRFDHAGCFDTHARRQLHRVHAAAKIRVSEIEADCGVTEPHLSWSRVADRDLFQAQDVRSAGLMKTD